MHLHQRVHALGGLEDDVADEAVADSDIELAAENIMAFHVADEVHAALLQVGVGGAGELVALVFLGADADDADSGLRACAEDLLGVGGAHDRELREPRRVAVHVGAGIDDDGRLCDTRGEDGRYHGAVDALDAAQAEEGGGGESAGVPGGHGRLGLALLHQFHADGERVVLLAADGGGWRLVHRDHFVGIDESKRRAKLAPALLQFAHDIGLAADHDDLLKAGNLSPALRGHHASADYLARRLVAAHDVNSYPHGNLPEGEATLLRVAGFLLRVLLLGAGGENLLAIVVAALGARPVSALSCAAIRALAGLRHLGLDVALALADAHLRLFPFWNCHFVLLHFQPVQRAPATIAVLRAFAGFIVQIFAAMLTQTLAILAAKRIAREG